MRATRKCAVLEDMYWTETIGGSDVISGRPRLTTAWRLGTGIVVNVCGTADVLVTIGSIERTHSADIQDKAILRMDLMAVSNTG